MRCSHDSIIKQIASSLGFFSVLAALPVPGSAETFAPQPEAVRAAECMVDVLKTAPGYVEAHVQTGPGYVTPVVLYAVQGSTGQVFHRAVEVYEDSSTRFSINMSEGVTEPLFQAWHRCGINNILYSYR